MTIHALYETRPLESWRIAREMREEYNRRAWGPRQEGRLVVGVPGNNYAALLAGIQPVEYLNLTQLGIQVGVHRDLAIRCAQAWEARGYARDQCAHKRMNIGAMFIDWSPGGSFPRPDFALDFNGCDNEIKGAMLMREYQGVQSFIIDYPVFGGDEAKTEHVKYLVSQSHDAVEWLEKMSGRKYRDDLLIEAVQNEFRSTSLWAKVWLLNQAIPAPVSQRNMSSLCFPIMTMPYQKETADYCRALLDEVQDRVNSRLAALPTERCRLFHEERPPYYFPPLLKHVEKYGAVFIGSRYDFIMNGSGFDRRAAGWEVLKTPEERGIEIRTRDDALQALAAWYLDSRSLCDMRGLSGAEEMVAAVDLWHADGVVMHQNRGCVKLTAGLAETKRGLQQRGIPNMTYEASSLDPRDFSEPEVMNQLESFLESLGLQRLEE